MEGRRGCVEEWMNRRMSICAEGVYVWICVNGCLFESDGFGAHGESKEVPKDRVGRVWYPPTSDTFPTRGTGVVK